GATERERAVDRWGPDVVRAPPISSTGDPVSCGSARLRAPTHSRVLRVDWLVHQPGQPSGDDLLCVCDDAVDEVCGRGHVVDDALHHADRPLSCFDVTVFEDLAATGPCDQVLYVFELPALVQDLDRFGGDAVLADAHG